MTIPYKDNPEQSINNLNHKAMKTKKYWYCEIDRMGQRTGNYCSVDLPECFVIQKDGFLYCGIDTVHNTGVIEKHTFLFTSETQAQRAALS